MRTRAICFAVAILFAAAAFAQAPGAQEQDRAFYFTNPVTDADVTSMVTLVRTVADIQAIDVHRGIVVHAPLEKLAVADWIFHILDRPAGEASPTYGVAPEYKIGAEDVVRVFRFPRTASEAELTALATSIRTTVDVQRLFLYSGQKAIVVRGPLAKVAASEWVFHQLVTPPGTAPDADSPAYPLAFPREPDAAIRVFRMNPDTSNVELTAIVTAIRTVADLQRLFPYEADKALVACGTPEKLALAEWLIHESRQSQHSDGPHQTSMAANPPYMMDTVVRIFYLPPQTSNSDLIALVTRIRTKVDIQRVLPLQASRAILLRTRPDQVSLIEDIIDKAKGVAQLP